MHKPLTLLVATGVVVGLAACAVGPDYRRPALDLPEQWNNEVLLSAQEREDLAGWWSYFEDPALQALVRRAVRRNLNIRLEIARVRETRARLGFAKAEQFPTVDLQIDAARQRASEIGGARDQGVGTFNLFSIAGALDYEVDLWGRLDRLEESARAALFSSIFARDAVGLIVITDVVTTYFRLLGAERQLAIALRTVRSRERGFTLERARYENGAADQLSFRQAQAELESARAEVPPLRQQVRDLESALSVLAGDSARQIIEARRAPRGTLAELRLPTRMPALLPSGLIERRPDIRASEAALMAANADIGATKAQYFPRLNLGALIGFEAVEIGDLFDDSSETWSASGSLLTPLLYFGRIEADVERARAIRQQAEVQYRRTVRTAFREVRDALTFLDIANQRLATRQRQIKALRRTLALARIRYRAGYSGFIEVLDAQRQLLDAELAATQADRDRYIATATLFKAMGGGWREGRPNTAMNAAAAENVTEASVSQEMALSPVGSSAAKSRPAEPTSATAQPSTDAPRSGTAAWAVQVGSFSKEANARALRDELRASGFAAFEEPGSSEGQHVFRVKAGPEIDRVRAEALRWRLRREKNLRGIVVSHPVAGNRKPKPMTRLAN
ncbi:MAG: efflux transporter outer membrane subunit [Gammaproteobacteria bacterium]